MRGWMRSRCKTRTVNSSITVSFAGRLTTSVVLLLLHARRSNDDRNIDAESVPATRDTAAAPRDTAICINKQGMQAAAGKIQTINADR